MLSFAGHLVSICKIIGLGVDIEKKNYYFFNNICMRVLNYKPAVVKFLAEEPFVIIEDGLLSMSLTCPVGTQNVVKEMSEKFVKY
jgi:hypothetical protein